MPHAPVSVLILRPLDELEPEGARQARGERKRARGAAHDPAVGRRGVLEVLDLALAILREHFALMVGLGALAWLPLRVLQPFIGAHVWERSIGSGAMFGPSLAGLVNTGGAALAECFGAALIAQIVHAALQGREVAPGPLLRAVLARLHVVAGVALVTAVATVAGTCACFVPGLLFSWKLSTAPMVCVLEGQGLRQSISRSWMLTRKGLWRWFFLTVMVAAIVLPFRGITAAGDWQGSRAQALAWSGLSGTTFDVVYVLVSSLLLGVAIALQAAMLTVYYADCRVRREGADLELQRAQLGTAEVSS
jgi:hypothetical protein